jgi:uncharacterized protein with PQ loop repeat
MDIITIIGAVASFLWGISLVPELVRTIKTYKCHIGYGMLFVTITASICSVIYTYNIHAIPLLINYSANLTLSLILLIYKLGIIRK